ncbi:hypothetical protein DEIGR_103075 [Deinococcus grandis]|uniref:Uncharacterized protein n=2 Tax=Deinococcus grandis TaxID=57498 RepID=A0A100HLT7_9DEIO|nr:hypothetical protein DEGR_01740 [Deinococcus grandis]GAQ23048.1 hypothetical protein DEIGR_103075 [Deinococcus grandis]
MRVAALLVGLLVGLWGGGAQAQATPFVVGVERVPEGLRVYWPSGGEVGVLSCRGATLTLRRAGASTTSPGPLRVLMSGSRLMFGKVTTTLTPDEVRFTCRPASPLPDVQVGADVSLRWR